MPCRLLSGACLVACLRVVLAGPVPIAVDYPPAGAMFPPDITAPVVLWRDASDATSWTIRVRFADGAAAIEVQSSGERRPVGEIDERCARAGAVPPQLTPEEAAGHSWKPAPREWEEIKRHSVKAPARITITGLAGSRAVSSGTGEFRTSSDPVGAPIFFRDVPLIPVPAGEKGVIMPLPTEAIPFIAWRLRYLNEPSSRLMMQGLPTCVNCHSFSRDGKTLGLDVDGPANDKGLYGIIPITPRTSIRNDDVIRWSSFADEKASKRFGFMSQLSPDGQFVVTSIEDPASHMRDFDARLFNGFYRDYGFGQVFYPTRGVLAWYSKASGKLKTLPGADDPAYVQTSAFWSPDGKYLVFSRAKAKDPYYEGQKVAEYANDPAETQIQYDLYRIPFNGGLGGTPEPIEGASQNGKSNNFPKVSPDGKWIVFVENKTGLLMRPDSELFIVPLAGGKARRLNCNTSRMNSWHSFSPNGRWMVFSSKARSLYTQMYLTHFDEQGRESPPILIENATAGNRAVNIPEFVNLAPGDMAQLDAPATDFYRVMDGASELGRKGDYQAAVDQWRKAIALDPTDGSAHYHLAFALDELGKVQDAIAEYRAALSLAPNNASAYASLGEDLTRVGDRAGAIEAFRQALSINPKSPLVENNLATALIETGNRAEGLEHLAKALALDPKFADAHNLRGVLEARDGHLDEAVADLQAAVLANPESTEYRVNLGRVLAARHNFEEAIPHFEKAVLLTRGQQTDILTLAAALYAEVGRFNHAVEVLERVLELATLRHDANLADATRKRIETYRARMPAR